MAGCAGVAVESSTGAHGRVVTLVPSEVPGLDPVVGVGSAGAGPMQRMYAIYGALLYTDSQTGRVKPDLAESMTTSDGGTTWTLKLRPDVKFSDGTALDAAAVKLNWDRHADPAAGSPWRAVVTSMTNTIVDPTTLQIVLKRKNGFFPAVVARSLSYIGSPTAIKSEGTGFSQKPVGAGPFVLRSWTRDSEMVLDKNPNYWDKGKPAFNELVFKVITDDQQRLNAYTSGEGDLAFVTDPVVTQRFQQAGAQMSTFQQFGGTGFSFNLKNPKWQDVRLRQAISLAVDRDQYSQVLSQGVQPGPKTMFKDSSVYSDPSAQTLPVHDLAKAQALLDQYYAATGKNSVEFTYTTIGAGTGQQAAELLQAQIQKLRGVTMKINIVNLQQVVASIVAKDFDVSQLSYRGAGPEPEFNELFSTNGSRNAGSYVNPVVDQAIAAARATTEETAQRAAFATAARQLLVDQPFILIIRDQATWAYKSDIHGVEMFEDGGLLFDKLTFGRASS
jgi:peptide/nickel transport system substrate-binding protein